MPNLPISGLPVAGTLDGSELTAVVKAGTTAQTTTQEIADLAASTGVGYVIARGAISGSGDALNSWVGIDTVTWSCGSPGHYVVNFTADFFGSVPTVVATSDRNEGSMVCNVSNVTLTSCEVNIVSTVGESPSDMAFGIIAIGPTGPPL